MRWRGTSTVVLYGMIKGAPAAPDKLLVSRVDPLCWFRMAPQTHPSSRGLLKLRIRGSSSRLIRWGVVDGRVMKWTGIFYGTDFGPDGDISSAAPRRPPSSKVTCWNTWDMQPGHTMMGFVEHKLRPLQEPLAACAQCTDPYR